MAEQMLRGRKKIIGRGNPKKKEKKRIAYAHAPNKNMYIFELILGHSTCIFLLEQK